MKSNKLILFKLKVATRKSLLFFIIHYFSQVSLSFFFEVVARPGGGVAVVVVVAAAPAATAVIFSHFISLIFLLLESISKKHSRLEREEKKPKTKKHGKNLENKIIGSVKRRFFCR